MCQRLQPYVRLVGEAAQLPAEDGLGRLHLAQRQQGPARLPPGAVRLVRVVEERAPALRAQRVHRGLDDQVVDQPERLASEVPATVTKLSPAKRLP